MRLLFVHQNFPGQFKHLVGKLAQLGWDIRALSQAPAPGMNSRPLPGLSTFFWYPQRSTTLQSHPLSQDFETKLIRAEAAAVSCDQLSRQGWCPDLIVGHPGWGEMLFLRHIWPAAPQLHYLEFFYAAVGLDVGFDPEFSLGHWTSHARITAKKAATLIGLEDMDAGICPTKFQSSTYPSWSQPQISVIHDGIDTEIIRPDPQASFAIPGTSISLSPGDPVITFVNRNLEPYRGYHRFMRALPGILERCPDAVALIVGSDGVSYGAPPPSGGSWKQIFLEEVASSLDLSRVFFLGSLPYPAYRLLLQVTACHVYLTYPFVLGWSCLEAMAAGSLVVGSATPPVQEVITDGFNGLLVDFFDIQALVDAVSMALHRPELMGGLRKAARATIQNQYDLKTICLPKQLALIKSLLG